MKSKICFLFFLLILAIALSGTHNPPVAEMRPDTLYIHGQSLVDNWAWLRDRNDPALQNVLNNEQEYTRRAMRPSRKLAKALFREFKANSGGDFNSHPYLRNGYYYYYREPQNLSYAINCRIADRPGAREEIILDENILARGHDYFYLDEYSISHSGKFLAYTIDTAGDEVYSLYIKNLETGDTQDTGLQNVSEVRWRTDDENLIITRTNARFQTDTAWQYNRISSKLQLLFQENDPAFDIGIYSSNSRELLFLLSSSKNTTEAWYMPLDGNSTELILFAERSPGHQYYPDYEKGYFYIQSDLLNPDTSIFVCSSEDTSHYYWEPLISGSSENPISTYLLCSEALIVKTRNEGFERLEICDPVSGELRYMIAPNEPTDISFWVNEESSAPYFYYTMENALMPYSIFRHDFATRSDSLVYRQSVRVEHHPENYKTEIRMVRAEDGTLIPLSLTYARSLDLSVPHPTLLSGYGAYGDSEDPYFSTGDFSILKRGVILAVAHIRGGGEFGKAWYDGGRLLNKKNSFSDFVACIDYLTTSGLSRRDMLAISGGSAGGLLMGAVINLAPERFKIAWADVPFVDALNTMLDPSLPLTVQEYEEWGDPNQQEYFGYIRSYCPYQNVSQRAYPEIYISAGWLDTRVGYWESLKWAQKLRTNNIANTRIVYRLLEDEGHSGSGDRFLSKRIYAEGLAYILYQIGIRR